MATANDLERRVAALEAEVSRLKSRLEEGLPSSSRKQGWQAIVGKFADDPTYEEAMRLGREYRESQRPGRKPTKAKSTKPKSARPKSTKAKSDKPKVKKG